MLRRLMPAVRSPASCSWLRVPGLASNVISAPSSIEKELEHALRMRVICSTLSRLGVPPPKKIVRERRGLPDGKRARVPVVAISVSKARTYGSLSGRIPA